MLLNHSPDLPQSIDKLKMHPQITINNFNKSVQTTVTTIVADNELSLVIELKDDTKHESNEAMGLATYSNSESTVLSYASIFETLFGSKVTKLQYSDSSKIESLQWVLFVILAIKNERMVVI